MREVVWMGVQFIQMHHQGSESTECATPSLHAVIKQPPCRLIKISCRLNPKSDLSVGNLNQPRPVGFGNCRQNVLFPMANLVPDGKRDAPFESRRSPLKGKALPFRQVGPPLGLAANRQTGGS